MLYKTKKSKIHYLVEPLTKALYCLPVASLAYKEMRWGINLWKNTTVNYHTPEVWFYGAFLQGENSAIFSIQAFV